MYLKSQTATALQNESALALLTNTIAASYNNDLEFARTQERDNVKINCENQGIATFNSQIASGTDVATLDAYFSGLTAPNPSASALFSTMSTEFTSWNNFEKTKEIKSVDSQIAQAAASNWFVPFTIAGASYPQPVSS